MIALRDGLPLLQIDDGRVVSFPRQWLRESLERAARKAGYPNWWLADHITEGVTNYLRQIDDNVVGVQRLALAVQSVLEKIGYAEVAANFCPPPPPVRISLLELAREAGSGYELAFFNLLKASLREHLCEPGASLNLHSLHACVKHLRSAKVWRQDCAQLRDHIVLFARNHSALYGADDIDLALT